MEAKVGFSKREMSQIEAHINAGTDSSLPPMLAAQLFEQYLSGSSLADICKHNPECLPGAIYYTAYQNNWPAERDEVTFELQKKVRQTVLVSKMYQLEFLTNMIKVAHTEANQAMRAYLKHPNDRNLPKTFRIKNIKELQMVIESISDVIGQDNNKNINVSGNITTENITDNQSTIGQGELSDVIAKKLIASLNKQNNTPVIEGEVVREEKKG